MEVTLPAPHLSIVLRVEEMSGVDEARRYGRRLAQAHGFNEADAESVMVVVNDEQSELAYQLKAEDRLEFLVSIQGG